MNIEAGFISREDERVLRLTIAGLRTIDKNDPKNWFNEREGVRQKAVEATGQHLTNSFKFIEETFGDSQSLSGSQEMVIFLTELSKAYHSLKFVRETGNDAYYEYNKLLLLNDRKEELKELAESLIL